jgi:hypothetical protein
MPSQPQSPTLNGHLTVTRSSEIIPAVTKGSIIGEKNISASKTLKKVVTPKKKARSPSVNSKVVIEVSTVRGDADEFDKREADLKLKYAAQ